MSRNFDFFFIKQFKLISEISVILNQKDIRGKPECVTSSKIKWKKEGINKKAWISCFYFILFMFCVYFLIFLFLFQCWLWDASFFCSFHCKVSTMLLCGNLYRYTMYLHNTSKFWHFTKTLVYLSKCLSGCGLYTAN